jgi:hypothetical protein
MKPFILAAVAAAACVLPAQAHPGHEMPYGLFWKAAAPQSSAVPAEIWKYAFVSKYTWTGCGQASSESPR